MRKTKPYCWEMNHWKTNRRKMNWRASCRAQKLRRRSQKETRARGPVPREPAIPQTTNRLSLERPLRQILAAPPNTKCDSPAKPGVGRLCDVSDSLVDDRGCLADRTERQALPCDVNLECRGPLNSTLDQRLGERVFNVLLQSPAQRAGTVAAVRARFLENPLTSLRREDHLHLPVD